MKRSVKAFCLALTVIGGASLFSVSSSGSASLASVSGIVTSPPSVFAVASPSAIMPALGELPAVVVEPLEYLSVKKNFPLIIKQQGKKIVVRWKSVNAAEYSLVLRSGKKEVYHTQKREISFKVKAGVKYSLFVKAYGSVGNFALGHSKKYSFIVPKSVKELKVRFLSGESASLNWKPCADKYLVYRKVRGVGNSFQLVKRLRKTYFVDSAIQSDTKYKYKVVAVNEGSVRVVSSPVTVNYSNCKIVPVDKQKYSYEDMSRDLKKLVNRYPNCISYSVIGKTVDGRKIYDVVLGNRKAKKSLLVVSTLHAREYMCSLLCMNQIEYYAGEESFRSVLDEIQIHYVVMANPDGVALSQFGNNAIKSAPLVAPLDSMGVSPLWKANARGVDLNKNFPYDFQVLGTAGFAGYSGTAALSEKESQAIVSLVERLRFSAGLCGVVNYHATGSIIYGDCEKKKSSSLFKQTAQMYETAVSLTGYSSAEEYSSGSSSGNFREFVMYQCKLPSITIEIGTQPCPLSISEFSSIWERNKMVVIEEAKLFL